MPEARPFTWRGMLPDRMSWVRLLASPSSYLLVVATIATSVAKLRVIRALDSVDLWPVYWLLASAADVAWFLGLAALFALGERSFRWVIAVTIPLALLIGGLGIANAGFIWVTGEQLSWQAVSFGLSRMDDLQSIVAEMSLVGPIVIGGALVAVHVGALLVLRRAGQLLHPRFGAAQRARAAMCCSVIGLLIAIAAPKPPQYSLRGLYGNAVARTYWGMATGDEEMHQGRFEFRGYTPRSLVDDASALATLRAGTKPNILLIVLESTGRDITTLGRTDAPARTPNLVKLANRGIEVVTARAVMPHTTKSLWSMMCGRLPFMQIGIYEASALADAECLPALLGKAGWRTEFIQSAVGDFEDRPRTVHQIGFQGFAAHEDIGGPRLGYLAGDDEPLVAQFSDWLDAAPGQPFMATLLTSGPHHEYELTENVRARAIDQKLPMGSELERHARMVEMTDEIIGRVVALLEARQLLDKTIIVVVGDHGEGFGAKGFRQHANNFYEEGLRVPWAMAGPGIPQRKIEGNASLIDLTPTLLDLLGVTLSPEGAAATPGRSLLGELPADRVLPFACITQCRGYVTGNRKIVVEPGTDNGFWFDLAKDPSESASRPLNDQLRDQIAVVDTLIHSTRFKGDIIRRVMNAFPPWTCRVADLCTHPNRGERRQRPERATN